MPTFADSVIVTAAGEEQAVPEVAAAFTLIDREGIAASGAVTVAELLRRVPGSVVLRSGLDNGVTTLFVRGTGSAHTLVLLDGVRLNSPFFGGYDWSLPVAAGIGRIEVVRGPYSALWGADAVGGVVQLLSVQGQQDHLRVLGEAGPGGWQRAEVGARVTLGRLDLTASALQRQGSGSLENDDFSSRATLVDLGWRFGDRGRVALLLNRTDTRTEIPFSGALPTPRRSTAAAETLVAAPLRLRLGGGSELEVTLAHVERRMTFRDPDDPFGFIASDTDAGSDSARAAYHLSWGRHHLIAGGEWRRDEVTDGSNWGTNLAGRALTTRSLFLQDRFALGAGWGLLGGVRWDGTSAWGSRLSPRATLSWQAAALRSWVSFGKAFRAPALGELYYPFSGNPALEPELSRAGELGVALPLASGRSSLQLVAFSNRIVDLVDFDYAAFRFANTARAAQDGIEASLMIPVTARAGLALALTYLDARDGAGNALLRRPEWSGAATLRGPLAGSASGELSLIWVGRRQDLDPVTYTRAGQPGFATASAALAAPLSDWLTLRLRAENLANRSYQEIRGYPAPGRRLFAGLELATR
ncbi:MAG: TonB-dependent receptor [Acidobacteriota bacterium]